VQQLRHLVYWVSECGCQEKRVVGKCNYRVAKASLQLSFLSALARGVYLGSLNTFLASADHLIIASDIFAAVESPQCFAAPNYCAFK
jgi:hypothetical protein